MKAADFEQFIVRPESETMQVFFRGLQRVPWCDTIQEFRQHAILRSVQVEDRATPIQSDDDFDSLIEKEYGFYADTQVTSLTGIKSQDILTFMVTSDYYKVAAVLQLDMGAAYKYHKNKPDGDKAASDLYQAKLDAIDTIEHGWWDEQALLKLRDILSEEVDENQDGLLSFSGSLGAHGLDFIADGLTVNLWNSESGEAYDDNDNKIPLSIQMMKTLTAAINKLKKLNDTVISKIYHPARRRRVERDGKDIWGEVELE